MKKILAPVTLLLLIYVAPLRSGIEIAAVIKDKIMQPFFITKPTSEGTGLGLSLMVKGVWGEHIG